MNLSMTRRQEKINSFIRELVSEFILKKIAVKNALITTTRADISSNLRNLKIFITVYPEKEENKALKELKNHYREWQEHLANNLKIKFLPYSEFLIDKGEKNRMKIEKLLK